LKNNIFLGVVMKIERIKINNIPSLIVVMLFLKAVLIIKKQ